MGILNVTPDSFFQNSRNRDVEKAMKWVKEIISAGVDIIDVGGVSTRPNADLLSTEEELKRVIPVIREINCRYPDVLVSVDTFRSTVARETVLAGAHIVNDVYGGRFDEQIFDTVAELDVPYILMRSEERRVGKESRCRG